MFFTFSNKILSHKKSHIIIVLKSVTMIFCCTFIIIFGKLSIFFSVFDLKKITDKDYDICIMKFYSYHFYFA